MSSTLSYDGKGINGPDEYRSRICTFQPGADSKTYGPMFAASPDMLEALRESRNRIDELCRTVNQYAGTLGLGQKVRAEDWTDKADAAIAKATGGSNV